MTSATDTMPREVPGRQVADFLPSAYHGLPLLRLFLPFADSNGDPVRWSALGHLDDSARQMSWPEWAERQSVTVAVSTQLEPTGGVLDHATAEALRDAVGAMSVEGLRWAGYGALDFPTVRVHAEDYYRSSLDPADLRAGARVPEFAWDTTGALAWGARLYPDSLIVAAAQPLFRQLFSDDRLDTVSVRIGDNVPWSAGD